MSKSNANPAGRIKRFMIRARDMYIKGMFRCANHVGSGGSAFGGPPYMNELPRSSSYNSNPGMSSRDEDLRMLIMAAELRRASSVRVEGEAKVVERVTRSRSAVQIVRIDEDHTCEFEEDAKNKQFLIPRSRSFAIEAKRRKSRLYA